MLNMRLQLLYQRETLLMTLILCFLQLLSVISLLSSDKPNLDSPANVDAAKEVRTDLAGTLTSQFPSTVSHPLLNRTPLSGYKKKVRRLVRRSAEEAFD
jgi:ubiquitin-conjugating enzyme E2 G1